MFRSRARETLKQKAQGRWRLAGSWEEDFVLLVIDALRNSVDRTDTQTAIDEFISVTLDEDTRLDRLVEALAYCEDAYAFPLLVISASRENSFGRGVRHPECFLKTRYAVTSVQTVADLFRRCFPAGFDRDTLRDVFAASVDHRDDLTQSFATILAIVLDATKEHTETVEYFRRTKVKYRTIQIYPLVRNALKVLPNRGFIQELCAVRLTRDDECRSYVDVVRDLLDVLDEKQMEAIADNVVSQSYKRSAVTLALITLFEAEKQFVPVASFETLILNARNSARVSDAVRALLQQLGPKRVAQLTWKNRDIAAKAVLISLPNDNGEADFGDSETRATIFAFICDVKQQAVLLQILGAQAINVMATLARRGNWFALGRASDIFTGQRTIEATQILTDAVNEVVSNLGDSDWITSLCGFLSALSPPNARPLSRSIIECFARDETRYTQRLKEALKRPDLINTMNNYSDTKPLFENMVAKVCERSFANEVLTNLHLELVLNTYARGFKSQEHNATLKRVAQKVIEQFSPDDNFRYMNVATEEELEAFASETMLKNVNACRGYLGKAYINEDRARTTALEIRNKIAALRVKCVHQLQVYDRLRRARPAGPQQDIAPPGRETLVRLTQIEGALRAALGATTLAYLGDPSNYSAVFERLCLVKIAETDMAVNFAELGEDVEAEVCARFSSDARLSDVTATVGRLGEELNEQVIFNVLRARGNRILDTAMISDAERALELAVKLPSVVRFMNESPTLSQTPLRAQLEAIDAQLSANPTVAQAIQSLRALDAIRPGYDWRQCARLFHVVQRDNADLNTLLQSLGRTPRDVGLKLDMIMATVLVDDITDKVAKGLKTIVQTKALSNVISEEEWYRFSADLLNNVEMADFASVRFDVMHVLHDRMQDNSRSTQIVSIFVQLDEPQICYALLGDGARINAAELRAQLRFSKGGVAAEEAGPNMRPMQEAIRLQFNIDLAEEALACYGELKELLKRPCPVEGLAEKGIITIYRTPGLTVEGQHLAKAGNMQPPAHNVVFADENERARWTSERDRHNLPFLKVLSPELFKAAVFEENPVARFQIFSYCFGSDFDMNQEVFNERMTHAVPIPEDNVVPVPGNDEVARIDRFVRFARGIFAQLQRRAQENLVHLREDLINLRVSIDNEMVRILRDPRLCYLSPAQLRMVLARDNVQEALKEFRFD